MTQNPFQPWKQNFSLPSQFYRKNDTDILTTISKVKNGDAASSGSSTSVQSRQFELGSDSPSYHIPVTSSSNNLGPQIDSDQPTNKPSQNGAKFSIFSQLLNLNKINAFDNLLLNASMSLEDEELSSDKRHGIKKLMEQAIRLDIHGLIILILCSSSSNENNKNEIFEFLWIFIKIFAFLSVAMMPNSKLHLSWKRYLRFGPRRSCCCTWKCLVDTPKWVSLIIKALRVRYRL